MVIIVDERKRILVFNIKYYRLYILKQIPYQSDQTWKRCYKQYTSFFFQSTGLEL